MIHCDLCNVRLCSSSGLLRYDYPSMLQQDTASAEGHLRRALRINDCGKLQANFAGDAQYKQHVEGPIHRKALAKAEAQRQRDLQLGASKGAAESALVRLPTTDPPFIA